MDARKTLAALCVAAAALPSWGGDDYTWAGRELDFATRQLDDFMWRHHFDLVDPVSRAVRRNGAARSAQAGTAGRTPAPAATAQASAGTVLPERAAQAPAAMAMAYSPAERARMESLFGQMLAGYRRIEQHFGVPARDLAGAVAAYVAGAYMAYHHEDFPDALFPALVAQMRGILAAEPAQAAAPLQARQEMYEQLAIIGMYAANAQMALKQRPNPALAQQVRAAGKSYLEQFLKVDADRVQLTERGLVVR
jgi:hypothetical protein